MKKIAILLFIFLVSINYIHAQNLLTEDFSYTSGTLLTATGNWTAHSSAGTNAITVTTPGLTYPNYAGTGVGGMITLTTSGEDDNRLLSSAVTTGTVYASAIVQVNTITSTTGDYFFHFGKGTTTFTGKLFVRKDATSGFDFGVSKSGNSTSTGVSAPIWSSSYTIGQPYLVVLKYTFVSGTSNDQVDLFVNPVPGGSEPAATITSKLETSADADSVKAIFVRQGTSSYMPTVYLDGIRVGLTWADVTPPNYYYSKSSGNLDLLTSWGTATNGSGSNPTSFASGTFYIRNNTNPTIGAPWTVGHAIVGDGTNACNFSIPAGYAVTGVVDVSTNATLTLQNTTLPTFGALNGTVVFAGSSAQTIPAAAFANLTINNASGVSLSAAATVSGLLTLTSGLVTTTAVNTLTLGAAATVAGGNSTSFVNGPVNVTGRSGIPMVAPVGKGSAYRPLTSTLTITSGSGVYSVEQFETAPTGSIVPSKVANLSPKRYFHIVETGNIVGTASIILTWGADDGVVSASKMTVVAGTNGGQWIAENNSGGYSGDATAGTIATDYQSAIASSGDFTLGFYSSTKNYYSAATGDLNLLTSWGSNLNGSGNNPSDLSAANLILNVQNRSTATISGNISLAPTSKIVVGDGTNACNFTIPTGFSVTGTVDVSNNAILTVQNTTLPTFGVLTGSIVLAGSAAQTLPAATFANLTINNASGVTLSAASTVNGVLTLTNGLVTTTAANMLTLGAAATVAGGSNSSFVNGPVTVTGRSTIPMVAPVGKGSAYRPLTSTLNITSGSGVFTVEQFETAPSGSIVPTNVSSISPKRYFHIVETGTIVGTASISLTWGADDGVVTPSKMTVVAGTNGGQWIAENNTGGYTGSASAGTVATDYEAAAVSSGDFTLGFYSSTKNYYSAATGDLNVLTTWGSNTNGTGSNPTDLSAANLIFNVQNRATATISGNISLASTSKIVVGDGTNACNFTIPTGFTVTGIVDVSTNGALTIQNTTLPTFGVLTGTVVLAGSSAQTLPAATFGNLTINNASGVTLSAASTVNGVLTLTNGLVTTTAANMLTLGAAATVAGGSNSSFVNGPVTVTGRSSLPMVAPVGKGSAYRPLTSTLTITSGSGAYTVEQFETAPTGSIVPTNVASLSPKRYFHIVETGNIVGTASIKLTWGADDGVVTPSKMTVVAGTNGGQWIAENNSGGYTGDASSGTIATDVQAAVASSGDFTLGFYSSTKNYYSAATGDLNVLTTWGTNLNGTGSNPSDFSNSNLIFNVQNRANATISGNLSIASSSKIVVGDGTNACNFTIPTGFSVTGTVDVANNATLTVQNTTLPAFGVLTGTVVLAGSAAQTLPAATFTNLTINNANGVTLSAASNVNGVFTLTNGLVTTTATNMLTLGAAAAVAGGSDLSFVNGPVTVTARNAVPMVAPVGKGAAYRPLTANLLITSGSGLFTVEQFESAPTGDIIPTKVEVISWQRYFHISEVGNIVGTATIKLTWGSDDGVVDPSQMTVVAGTNGSQWAVENNSGGYSGTSTAGTIATDYESASAISNGDFALGFYINPLPVNLSSFTAAPSNGAIKISWNTAVEVDNHGFNVERSTDKSAWTTLTFIKGQGNSNAVKSYSYSDNNITKAGKYYYRLKQLDNNGGYKYSSVIEADFILPTIYSLNQNFPNPFNPNTIISYALPEASNVKITVYNAIGETIQIVENGFKSAGNYSLTFNANNIPSGIYFYRIEAGKFSQVRKMMLLK